MRLLALLLGSSLLGFAQSAIPTGDCKYGQLPGRWVDAPPRSDNKEVSYQPTGKTQDWKVWYQPTGKKQEWKLFGNGRCKLWPLAAELLTSNYSGTGSRVPILFIGDSTDRLIQQDICDLGKMVGARVDSVGYDTDQTTLRVPLVDGKPQKFKCDHCSGCMTDFATIGHSYVWGVQPEGPYHYSKTGSWKERIPDVVASFKNLTGTGPELVVFASNFWDIASWSTKNASILDRDDFENHVMEEYELNLSHVLSTIEDLVPTTAIKVFKTSAWPEPADCMGQASLKGYLGRKSHVAQLNAAGKNMAMMHGWEVVDLEPLVAKFGHPSQYLRDNIHPHMFLNMEIFNIYLNILRDHGHFAPQAQSM